MSKSFIPVGSNVLDSTIDTATELTNPAGRFDGLFVTVETQNVRYTIDGSAPVAGGNGHLLEVGPGVILPFGQGTTYKFIADTAGAKINYQFVKWAYAR